MLSSQLLNKLIFAGLFSVGHFYLFIQTANSMKALDEEQLINKESKLFKQFVGRDTFSFRQTRLQYKTFNKTRNDHLSMQRMTTTILLATVVVLLWASVIDGKKVKYRDPFVG